MHPVKASSVWPAVVARIPPHGVFGIVPRKLSTTAGSDSISSSPTPSSSSSSSASSSSLNPSPSTRKYANFNADPNYRPTRSSPRRSKLGRPLFMLGWIPVAAFITSHLYSLGNVTGGSMSPTFNGPYDSATAANSASDVVLLNRTVKVNHQELKAGDIVTLISPLDPRLLLTKRIIALPGDTVRVYLPAKGSVGGGKWSRIKIPPGHVWVEGDAAVDIVPGSLERVANAPPSGPAAVRGKSRDSREFGPVPMGLITSRIEWIVWPPQRFGAPGPRPSPSNMPARTGQFPPSATESRSTQVNPSLARILDELTQMAPGERKQAHPEDSVISPYVDWEDPDAKAEPDGEGGGEGGIKNAKQEERQSDKLRKAAWNGLSRGGRLGDDAD